MKQYPPTVNPEIYTKYLHPKYNLGRYLAEEFTFPGGK
jgi:hypothetical protein